VRRRCSGRLYEEAENARRELAESQAQLQRHAGQLEVANRDLQAFSYSVSHDLRGPLRAIRQFAQILCDDHAPELSDEAQRLLGIVISNSQRMSKMLDSLLVFARYGQAGLRKTAVDMTQLAQSVVDELHQADSVRPVSIRIHPLPPIEADASLVRQVLANLVSNALKFTRGRADAQVEIHGGCEPGENVYSVADNGVGFDMEYVGRLFGVFQRLHREEEFEGTGIGLAIAHRIIQRHGGRIWAEASPDQGARFHFSLPV
jgi:light-regulated signal transduction histidine kinase (bacteriophytochrome)